MIVASYPIIALIAEILFKRASFNLMKLMGMIIAIVGVWKVVQHGPATQAEHRSFGIILLFIGGLVWTAYNLLAARSSTYNVTPLTITYYQTTAGAAGFLLASLFEVQYWRPVSFMDISILGYLAIACLVGVFLLYNAGLRALLSANAVNILNLVPVFGRVWVVIIAKETINFCASLWWTYRYIRNGNLITSP